MKETMQILFGLVGGLSLFLYGMNSMSDALQKAAGEKMKKILSILTKNPIMGALAGALVTAVLQSSSATTVMVIGFVSAGLMNLPQAISVIFGANIGTTMTAQLMAFKISDYIYPIIFVGFMLNFVCKKERLKNIGMVLFSFGLLFEGIEIMGTVMKPLAGSQFFVDMMAKVTNIPVLGVLLGAGMTLVVQSSSATIAVLQNFASQAGPDGVSSVIGLAGAIPILLGDNIGTTITALLASIGQSKNAKRTAIAHSVFNITGSIVFLFLIPVLTKFVQFISPKGPELEVISRQIANAHTTFNVVCTLIWLPLIPIMVKIVTFLVRGNDRMEGGATPSYLDDKVIAQPVAALYLASNEVRHVSEMAKTMLQEIKQEVITAGSESQDAFLTTSANVKTLCDRIEAYLTKMFSSGTLTERQSEQTASLLFVTNHLERISDRCREVDAIYERIGTNGKALSETAQNDLAKCFDINQRLFDGAMDAVMNGNMEVAQQITKEKNKMRKSQKRLNKDHLLRVEQQLCDPALTNDFSSLLYSLDRLADSCVGIAEEAMEGDILLELDGEAEKEVATA